MYEYARDDHWSQVPGLKRPHTATGGTNPSRRDTGVLLNSVWIWLRASCDLRPASRVTNLRDGWAQHLLAHWKVSWLRGLHLGWPISVPLHVTLTHVEHSRAGTRASSALCASRACDRSRSGCPMCALQNSSSRHTANLWP